MPAAAHDGVSHNGDCSDDSNDTLHVTNSPLPQHTVIRISEKGNFIKSNGFSASAKRRKTVLGLRPRGGRGL
jgi:hypothetical protein